MINKEHRKNKQLVSLFYLDDNIAGKDMFLVPKYLSDTLGMECTFVFPRRKNNEHLRGRLRGVKLMPIRSGSAYYSSIWREKERLWWLIRHARQIDVLSLFWLNKRNFARVYKLLNPKGICYVKGDMSSANPTKRKLKAWLLNCLTKPIDVLSVETEEIYNKIRQGNRGKHLADSVVWMPNGYDIDMLKQIGVQRKNYTEKDNLIITVARIGSQQKDNITMLRALDGKDLCGWRFEMIGPVESSFETIFDEFMQRNPQHEGKIHLQGLVNDRKKLWEKYNQAKVFLLTSTFECMAQVYSEALAFGDYIITTRVQVAEEITAHQTLGRIIEVKDADALWRELQQILIDDSILKTTIPKAHELADKQYNWRALTQIVASRIMDIYRQNEKTD